MEEKVRSALLEAGFQPDEIRLEVTQTGKVGGFVVSAKFAGKSQIERQDSLWASLEKSLTSEDLLRIVSILTMTPAEVDDDVPTSNGEAP